MSAAPKLEPPLIYISYSRKDEAWLNKTLHYLEPLESSHRVRIFYDRHLSPGETWDATLRANLEQAALGIILLSPEWLANEYATSVEFTALESRHIIPILVSDCLWQHHPISKFQILMAGDKPLSHVRGPKQEQAFGALVESVRDRLGISRDEISGEVTQLWGLATKLALSRKERGMIDIACLVYAFLERGRAEPTPIKTPQFLWNSIPASGQARFEDLRHNRFPLSSQNEGTAVVIDPQILDRAAALSRSTMAGGTVHARHLLAAVLTAPDAAPIFGELDLDLAAFNTVFLRFVFGSFPDEPQSLWRDFFAPAPNPLSQPPDDTAPPPAAAGRLIAAYQSEDWTGPDLLNTTRDVNALAALVAGWNVQPPLSIGLFGEWGSGKSFFMRQMRKRVKALALAAQKSGKPQRECAYYKNIAQIEFNAWHYMEGDNLWACLVEHIFSNLGLPQDTTAAQIQSRQKEILEKIGAKKTLEAQAAQARTELEAKRDDARDKAQKAQTDFDATEKALDAERTALQEKVTGQLSSEVTDVLNSIPEAVQLRDQVETARKLSQDVRSLWGRIALFANLMRNDPRRRAILYWMLGGSALLFVLGQIIHWAAPGFQMLVRGEFQALLPILTAAVATAGRFRPVLGKIGHIVSVLESKNQEITEAISKAEREQQRQIARLEGDLKTLNQQIDQATREQQQHQQAIQKLEKDLAETDASLLLGEFIRSRADADDYRKHLGMVALVRRDFERLSDFFRQQREDEQGGKERPDNNTVNRIILYIDDLDRCPPQTVVNTLQAIHLLLAFPIFVVVVAVDARWVSRSLEQCYDWLVPDNPPAELPRTTTKGAERFRSPTGATAHDYLEKIFQIPFWLAPMNSDGCRDMIRGLTAAISREHSSLKQSIELANQPAPAPPPPIAAAAAASGQAPSVSPASVAPAPSPSRPPEPAPSTPVAPPPAETHIETVHEEIDLHPRQLDVEKDEMRKIDDLATLIGRSPRVAKRFLNCYRLLKARMDDAQLQEFLDGPFQSVMEVLAIIVGAPSISRIVVDSLSTENAAHDGKAFLTQLAQRLPAGALTGEDGMEVARLLSAATADHMKSLRAMAPLVARFSFATHTEKARDTDPAIAPRKRAASPAASA
jgi:TIR domain/KAP family P-loop domain